MQIAIAGGGMIDVATREDMDRHYQRLATLLARPQARAKRLAGFITTPAAVGRAPIITLQHPPPGALWKVEWIRTQQADPGTAVANVSMIGYIGASAAQPTIQLSASGLGWDDANAFTNLLAVPSLTSIPDQVVVYPTEELYFGIAGTAGNIGANTKYGVIVGVIELPNTPEALTWL